MTLPTLSADLSEADFRRLAQSAKEATDFLKALSHEGRLMILCYLADGEKSVIQLEQLLSQRQPTVSQQLARLRMDGLVEARRDGKMVYYQLAGERVLQVMQVIYDQFCDTGNT